VQFVANVYPECSNIFPPFYNTNKQIRVFPEQLGYYPWAIMDVLPVVYP
jgi:hypothetical protein